MAILEAAHETTHWHSPERHNKECPDERYPKENNYISESSYYL
jgi:hypothetical protein